MRSPVQLQKITRPWQDLYSWTLLLGVIAYWSCARIFVPSNSGVRINDIWLPPCPLKALTGVPCPFCGLTTGSAWMARGSWQNAWESNILSPMLMVGAGLLAGYVLLFRLVAGRALRFDDFPTMRKLAWIVPAVLVAVAWLSNLFGYFGAIKSWR